jgi:hypothetical protein
MIDEIVEKDEIKESEPKKKQMPVHKGKKTKGKSVKENSKNAV